MEAYLLKPLAEIVLEYSSDAQEKFRLVNQEYLKYFKWHRDQLLVWSIPNTPHQRISCVSRHTKWPNHNKIYHVNLYKCLVEASSALPVNHEYSSTSFLQQLKRKLRS